jgi:hypothetical protein
MIRLLKAAAVLLCAAAFPLYASTSAMTATVSDADGQMWYGGSFTASLKVPNFGADGVRPTVAGVPVVATVTGVLSAGAVITVTLTDTKTLDQTNSFWRFVVCPKTSGNQCVTLDTPVFGSTPDLTPSFSLLAAPRFAASGTAYGYADSEVSPLPPAGTHYFNLVLNATRIWDGKAWSGGSSSAALSTIASATTISPTSLVVVVSGAAAIATITPPSGYTAASGGCIDILATGAWTTTTAGNIFAIMTATANTSYRACYMTVSASSKWYIK